MDDIDKAIQLTEAIKSGEVFNPVALTVHQQVKKRIFSEGKNAKDRRIGNYAPSTLAQRSSKKYRGKVPQSRYIILEFTGQMRRDFAPIMEQGVIVGSGFKQAINSKKRIWIERNLKQKIFALTAKEQKLLETLLARQIKRLTQ